MMYSWVFSLAQADWFIASDSFQNCCLYAYTQSKCETGFLEKQTAWSFWVRGVLLKLTLSLRALALAIKILTTTLELGMHHRLHSSLDPDHSQ